MWVWLLLVRKLLVVSRVGLSRSVGLRVHLLRNRVNHIHMRWWVHLNDLYSIVMLNQRLMMGHFDNVFFRVMEYSVFGVLAHSRAADEKDCGNDC